MPRRSVLPRASCASFDFGATGGCPALCAGNVYAASSGLFPICIATASPRHARRYGSADSSDRSASARSRSCSGSVPEHRGSRAASTCVSSATAQTARIFQGEIGAEGLDHGDNIGGGRPGVLLHLVNLLFGSGPRELEGSGPFSVNVDRSGGRGGVLSVCLPCSSASPASPGAPNEQAIQRRRRGRLLRPYSSPNVGIVRR